MTLMDLFSDQLSILPFIFYRAIFVVAIVSGWQLSRAHQLDNLWFCLAITAVLFFFSNGFLVTLTGFNPLQILAISLIISKSLRELIYL